MTHSVFPPELGPTERLIDYVSASLAMPLLPAALRISSASQAMYEQKELSVERGSFLLLHKNVLANAGTLHG